MSDDRLMKGVSPALITPFKAEGGVDVDAAKQVTKFHLDAGVYGFYLCGNTGEGFYASKDERKQMVEAVMEAMKEHGRKIPVMVMIAARDVADAIELGKHAKAQGCDAISSVVPIDKPNNLPAAVEYWKQIGEAVDLPFYIYWMANTADKAVTPEQFLQAMAQVPNFKGFKFTDTNFYVFQQLMYLGQGQNLNGVTGPDEMMAAGLMMGSDGAIGSTYNIHPKLACSIYNAFQQGDLEGAKKGQEEMNRIISVLLRHCKCNEKGTNIIAGIKCIYERKYGIRVGVAKEGAALRFSEEQQQQLMEALDGMRVE